MTRKVAPNACLSSTNLSLTRVRGLSALDHLRPVTAGSFEPQFFPKLQGIQQLFAQTITAASLWVHLLSINLFAARAAYLHGWNLPLTNAGPLAVTL